MKCKMKIQYITLILLIFLLPVINAETELVNTSLIIKFGLPLHFIELFMALFISFMSLNFFRITKPLNIFLYIYLALGFFIISSLMYIVYYLRNWLSLDLNFVNVYVASRLSLIAMLIVFSTIFYNAHSIMKNPMHSVKSVEKNKKR